jgi:hypothetical protein
MALQNADFQQRIAPTLQTFIENPGSLTVTLKPEEPVPVMTVIQTVQQAPQRLPDILAVEVERAP